MQTLANLTKAVYLRGKSLLITSINDKRISLPNDLMALNDTEQVGTFALTLLLSEYMDLHNMGVLSKEYSESCCKNHLLFGLPCKHLLLARMKLDANPLVTLDDIPQRWRRSIYSQCNEPNTITTIVKKHIPNDDWSYASCVSKFERYFSFAKRSQEIRDILDKTLNTLQSIEHISGEDGDILPPRNLLISGPEKTHPRNNVDHSGAPRKRKKYSCSICGSDSHTAPRCPANILKS